ncbi:Nuclear pore complex protein NUP96 [Vitis vinifera]|uniref:Nuclear pore complex protein NUP96 n=1 Tax=Vitis vinifera TaxID=29760 RepID=A0A438I480_VITVI|nr:Nuclear pore complex protein NUP96 [Vitis vinifera]
MDMEDVGCSSQFWTLLEQSMVVVYWCHFTKKTRTLNELHSTRNSILFGTTMGMGCDAGTSGSQIALHQYKRRKFLGRMFLLRVSRVQDFTVGRFGYGRVKFLGDTDIRSSSLKRERLNDIVEKLRLCTKRQGADFISFNPSNGEWKFLVHHFSRFGLSEDDEEDIAMDDATVVQTSTGNKCS